MCLLRWQHPTLCSGALRRSYFLLLVLLGSGLGRLLAAPPDTLWRTRMQAALAAYQMGDLGTALPVLREVYPAVVATADREEALNLSLYLAHGPAMLGRSSEAWQAYDSLEARRQRWLPQSRLWYARSRYIKGQMHSMLGENLQAIAEAQAAWRLSQQTDSVDHPLRGGIAHTLGVEYGQLGDRLSALTWLRRAIGHEEATSPPNYYQLNLLYFATAQTLGELGDLTNAELYLDQCVRLIRQQPGVPSDFLPGTYTLRGNLLTSQGDYAAALEAYQTARRLFQRQSDGFFSSDSIHAINGVGLCYRGMGRDSAAFRSYQQALDQAVGMGDGPQIRNLVPIMINLAISHRELGRVAEAKQTLHRALRFLDQRLDVPWQYLNRASLMVNLARNHLTEGKYDSALYRCQLALHIYGTGVDSSRWDSEPTQLPPDLGWDLAELLAVKARAYAQQHRAGAAPEKLRQARRMLQLADSAIALAQRNLSYAQDKHLLVGKMISFYELGIELALQADEPAEALELAERASSRLFRLNLQASRFEAAAEAPPEWLTREQALLRQRYHWQQQLAQTGPDQVDARDSLHTLLFDQQQAYDRLQAQLAEIAPQYHRLRYQEPRLDLVALQATLRREDSWCFRYFWGEERLHIFRLDGEQLRHRSLAIAEVAPRLEGLIDHLHNGKRVAESGYRPATFHAFADTAWQLAQLLLGPDALQGLPASLRIVPDGPLAYLPFEILLTSTVSAAAPVNYAGLPYLFRQSGLRYGYTAAPLDMPPREVAEKPYLGIAPSHTGKADSTGSQVRDLDLSHLAPLRGNIPEVKQVARLMQGQAWTAALATEARFKAKAPQARVLHLSTHTVFDDRNPMYSGLLFDWPPQVPAPSDTVQEDGILYAYELYGLRLRAELAVLSACQTGSGRYQRGEGVASLARAFHYAGCPSVLMSLWPVEDLATKDLMVEFFTALQAGTSQTEALQAARERFLAEQPKQHPHYWAGFVLMDHRPTASPARVWAWGLGATAFLLLGLMVWGLGRRRRQGRQRQSASIS